MKFKEYLLEKQQQIYSNSTIMIIWKEANDVVFSGALHAPKFSLEQSLSKYHKFFIDADSGGEMLGFCDWTDKIYDQRTTQNAPVSEFNPVLRFSKSIETRQMLEEIVVHEMVHQKIAQEKGYKAMCEIGHGPEFMAYTSNVKKYKNIDLYASIGND